MPVVDVTLGGGTFVPRAAGGQTVYTRTNWLDSWEAQDDLWCEEAVWCAAPSIPTATLIWHYGLIAPTGTFALQEILRRADHTRIYVRVTFRCQVDEGEFQTRDWYGVIEVDEDMLLGEAVDVGSGETIATGQQTFTAYGMENLLDKQFVNHAYYDADGAGDIRRVERPIIFNRNGKPNRTASESGDSHHFARDLDNAEFWTTRDIVKYLLRYHSPRDASDTRMITYELNTDAMAAAVPDWDHPTLDPSNRSTYSLLTSLIPRQRLTSFRVGLDDADDVNIYPFTFTDSAIPTIGGGDSIPANTSEKRILCSRDQSGEAAVKTTATEKYDVVIARGARRRSVATFSYDDNTLEDSWLDADEATYGAGASGATGYAALSTDDKRRRNQEVRSQEKLRNVFSRFQIIEQWDGKVRNGLGAGDLHPVFIDDEDPPNAVEQYDPELFVESTMPLLEGVDYSGSKIVDESVNEPVLNQVEAPPLVLWKEPASGRYCNIEKMSSDRPLLDQKEEWNWSASVIVPDEFRGFRLAVSGAPQHVLDHQNFTPLPADEDLGEHNWRQMLATLSLQDDRYAEARYPETDEALPESLDYINRLLVVAGDKYRLDYVVPDTVVNVDEDGAIVRSDGGFVHDDRDELKAIARIAWEWYSRDRRVLYLATDQLTTELEIGDMVTAINQADDNGTGTHYFAIATPITEIRINSPEGTSDSPPTPPRMRIATDAGQLDALAMVDPDVSAMRILDELKERPAVSNTSRYYDPGSGSYFADPYFRDKGANS